MKGRITAVKKSKLPVVAAVFFLASAVLLTASVLQNWFRGGMPLPLMFIFPSVLFDVLTDFLKLLVPVLFFLSCLLLLFPKLEEIAVAIISIAVVMKSGLVIYVSIYRFTALGHIQKEFSLMQRAINCAPDILLVLVLILFLLTLFMVLKTKIPILICFIIVTLNSALTLSGEIYTILNFGEGHISYYNVVKYGADFLFWAAMCCLVFTFPNNKRKKVTGNINVSRNDQTPATPADEEIQIDSID